MISTKIKEHKSLPDTWQRQKSIGMPQMALSGLSELWLFKELGDIHWEMISDFLQVAPSEICDAEGNRLYATFGRVVLETEHDLHTFNESDTLETGSYLDRYGAGHFFGTHEGNSPNSSFHARTMSIFAKHGQRQANKDLVRGEPVIVDPGSLPALKYFPDIGTEHRAHWANENKEVIFTCPYDILPVHDINGVGLLYFAAYPAIFDLCVDRYEGGGFLLQHSTVFKDVRYMGNADPDEQLLFQLHSKVVEGDLVHHHGSIWREGDMRRIAEIKSTKRRV